MAKGPQILTANRLNDGTVLYWTGTAWAEPMAEARLYEEAAAKAALAAAEQSVAAREVINPYLFEVRIADGIAVPLKERERVRAAGPTIRRDLGKQAGAATAPHFHIGPVPQPPKPVEGQGPESFDVSL
jgi:hypothetical protein